MIQENSSTYPDNPLISFFPWRNRTCEEVQRRVKIVRQLMTLVVFKLKSNCSDFRYESNGIFVLGVGFFFLQTNFDFLTSHFWRNFFISFKRYCCPELKFEKIFHLWSFFVKLWGFKDCHFDQLGTINARDISRYSRVSGELIRLRNRSKLVERSLFAIIDLLQGAKSILLCSIWRVGGWFLFLKNSNFRKKNFIIFFSFNFLNVITAP